MAAHFSKMSPNFPKIMGTIIFNLFIGHRGMECCRAMQMTQRASSKLSWSRFYASIVWRSISDCIIKVEQSKFQVILIAQLTLNFQVIYLCSTLTVKAIYLKI